MHRSSAPTRLLGLMAAVASEETGRLPDWAGVGVVGAGMSLTIGRRTYPAGSWRQSEWFALPDPMLVTDSAGVGDHGGHTHTIPRPSQFRPLEAGDRVLVVIHLQGTEPCAIARMVGT